MWRERFFSVEAGIIELRMIPSISLSATMVCFFLPNGKKSLWAGIFAFESWYPFKITIAVFWMINSLDDENLALYRNGNNERKSGADGRSPEIHAFVVSEVEAAAFESTALAILCF